jgi:hypothetical protein
VKSIKTTTEIDQEPTRQSFSGLYDSKDPPVTQRTTKAGLCQQEYQQRRNSKARVFRKAVRRCWWGNSSEEKKVGSVCIALEIWT